MAIDNWESCTNKRPNRNPDFRG